MQNSFELRHSEMWLNSSQAQMHHSVFRIVIPELDKPRLGGVYTRIPVYTIPELAIVQSTIFVSLGVAQATTSLTQILILKKTGVALG
jgi:hypothetical protein